MDNNEILLKTLEKEKELLKENLANIRRETNAKLAKFNDIKARNDALEQENKELREQLDSILYSRSYKFSQKLKKIIKR